MIWSSLSVLALTVVSALGLPRPDEYKIPAIPNDSRAQYYILHDDGTYKYGYDTDTGLYESAVKMGGNVNGFFGYTDPNGQNVRLDYTAGGEGGFIPSLSVDNAGQVYSAPAPAPAPAPVVKSVYQEPDTSLPRGDASYSFSYRTDDSHRHEEADADLNVKGEFGFVADDGVRRQVNYIAGSGTGFVATGDHLPVAPEVPGPLTYAAPAPAPAPAPVVKSAYQEPDPSLPRGDASYSFSYRTDDSHRHEEADADLNVKGEFGFVADDGVRRQVNYIAGSGTGFVATGDHLPVAPEVPGPLTYAAPAPAPAPAVKSAYQEPDSSLPRGDASYSFSYRTDDSHRHEEADADLNVKGEFGFVADDGVRRQVNYIAGSGTGFVATGDHLPVAPEVPGPLTYAAPAPAPAPAPAVKSAYQEPDSSLPRGDASYSFSYRTDDSHRYEEADSDLNVKGEFGFVADDGVRRQVNYIAGSGTGFVATGDHLPVAPEVPGPLTYAAPAPAPAPAVKSAYQEPDSSLPRGDASYSFSYRTDDSHRHEEADADLNVKGEFGFVADDGVRRQVNYIAGSGTGFVATGDHLPVAPEVPGPLTYAAPAPAPAPVVKSAYQKPNPSLPRGDASYSFSYDADESSRKEEADSDLNVKGEFSFVADDGVRRHVNYVAGSETGFVAEGDHLPVAPEVPGPVEYAVPATAPVRATSPFLKSGDTEVVPITYNAGDDGSYSFSYETSDSHRKEEADSDLNVKGEFGFVADDGVRRQVNYIAGSGTGFVATGDHLPVAPQVPGPLEYSAPAPAPAPAPLVKSVYEKSYPSFPRNDASYSFSYDADESSRKEEADSDLNVKGEFDFVADDGIRRHVSYIAGSGTGFVATGNHLPEAPEAANLSPVPSPAVPVLKTVKKSEKFHTVPQKSHSSGSKGGFSEGIVGNVLVRQYGADHGSKFGYVYTEI